MFISKYFSYNGIYSKDILENQDLIIARSDTGLIEQRMGVSRQIRKEKIKDRVMPYSYGVDEEVITFPIQIIKNKPWTYDERGKICEWLQTKTYEEFISDDDINIVYKCKTVGEPIFRNTSRDEGFAEFVFECDAPHAWSKADNQYFNLPNNTTSTTIQIYNNSNFYHDYKPEIEVELLGTDTGFKLVNLSDNNREFEFTNLAEGETVYIDNDKENIISDLSSDTYRLGNLTDKRFFRLKKGINQVEVYGKVNIHIRSQFPLMV